MNFGQGKVSEKSGNFISDLEWAPLSISVQSRKFLRGVFLFDFR